MKVDVANLKRLRIVATYDGREESCEYNREAWEKLVADKLRERDDEYRRRYAGGSRVLTAA